MVAPLLGSMVIFGSVIVSRSAALVTVAQSFADGPMYAFTAARVFGPNLPSAPPLGQYPLPQRKSCTHLTSSPVEPSLRGVFTGLFGLDKSVVVGELSARRVSILRMRGMEVPSAFARVGMSRSFLICASAPSVFGPRTPSIFPTWG